MQQFFFLLINVIVIGGLALLGYKQYEAAREKERKLRIKLDNAIDELSKVIENVARVIVQGNRLLDFESGYCNQYRFSEWRTQHQEFYSKFGWLHDHLDKLNIPQSSIQLLRQLHDLDSFDEKKRSVYNQSFVKHELREKAKYFQTILDYPLDVQQQKAIVVNEDNNLVIAGAGTGKTTTIAGKLQYMIDRFGIDPSKILLISFTRSAANELSHRVRHSSLQGYTFHKLGLEIITESEGVKPTVFDDEKYKSFIAGKFSDLLKTSPQYQKLLVRYFNYYLKPPKEPTKFENKEEYIQYLKEQRFRSYKKVPVYSQGTKTLRNEIVKSAEECLIANFLVVHNIDYGYEEPYPIQTADKAYQQYKPDFTIRQDGRIIYLEHFGVSRNGSVPAWFDPDGDQAKATEKYQNGIRWKRELHSQHSTTLIETYSYELGEGDLLPKLKAKLQKAGIRVKPLSNAEIWKIIEENLKYEVTSFKNLIYTFITLMKANELSIASVEKRIKENSSFNKFDKERASFFLELVEPLFTAYQKHLKAHNEVDFTDMINRARMYVENGSFHPIYDYIVIDEFQDISIDRYKLIKAIKDKNLHAKLFAVGDDWQSIFRFAGSDLTLFREFEKYYGETEKSKIETTYRFGNPLLDVSSGFVQKNPVQERKKLKNTSGISTEVRLVYSSGDSGDDTQALLSIAEQLARSYGSEKPLDVMLLGRYDFDFDRIANDHPSISKTTAGNRK